MDSSRSVIWWLTAVGVTDNSNAAFLKLRWQTVNHD